MLFLLLCPHPSKPWSFKLVNSALMRVSYVSEFTTLTIFDFVLASMWDGSHIWAAISVFWSTCNAGNNVEIGFGSLASEDHVNPWKWRAKIRPISDTWITQPHAAVATDQVREVLDRHEIVFTMHWGSRLYKQRLVFSIHTSGTSLFDKPTVCQKATFSKPTENHT